MPPTVAELMRALPEESEALAEAALREPLAFRPVPVGRWRRLRLLATLQTRIAAAYLFYWIRGWFQRAEQQEQLLAETHWKTAMRLFDSMGYLRGAVMKALRDASPAVRHEAAATLVEKSSGAGGNPAGVTPRTGGNSDDTPKDFATIFRRELEARGG